MAFRMLQRYMQEERFAAAIREYYTTWKFLHPSPRDLEAILVKHCVCDLSWFFDGLMGSDALIDYRIMDWTADHVTIENRGTIAAPVHCIAFSGDHIIRSQWYDGFHGTRTFAFSAGAADRVQIYADDYTLDIRPGDNILRIEGGRTRAPQLKVRITGGKEHPGERYLNLLPVVGWNHTDKLMPGIAISNTYWPPRALQWGIVPMISLESGQFIGLGEIQYRLFPDDTSWNLEFGLSARSFHYAHDRHYGFQDRFQRAVTRFRMTRTPATSQITQSIQYRFAGIRQQFGTGINFDEKLWERRSRTYGVHEIQYTFERPHAIATHKFTSLAHAGQGFLRITADVQTRLAYLRPGKYVYLHGFAGWLPVYDNPKANVLLHFNGIQSTGVFSRDFLYDEILSSRNASSGIRSQIVFMKDARLKTLYTGGISDHWMFAAGIAADTPLPLPVQPYLDVALYSDPITRSTNFSYSGGLALIIQKDLLEVYVPLVESSDIRNSLTYLMRDSLLKRISIMLNLKKLHPYSFKGYVSG
jgi:hypothetical protein